MSKGPGHVERTIEAAFTASPSATFTVEDLCAVAYPGVNRVEKKHRVAVLRAADKAAARVGWRGRRADRPGHAVIYFNLINVHSYALGKLRLDFLTGRYDLAELETRLSDPKAHGSRYDWIQPGGAWWRHVEIHKADLAGDGDASAAMHAELLAHVNAQMARLPPLR